MLRVRGLGRSSRPRFQHQAPLCSFSFPPPGPAGPVPRLRRYYEGATTSNRPSRRTPFPSFGGTSVSLVTFAPRRTSAPPRPGVGHPVSPAGNSPRSEQGSPKFLGNPNCPFAHVPIRRRRDCLHQTAHSAAAWPLVEQRQRLPRKVFRRSIAWLSNSLSTLRRTGYPATTQDSLPAAGQALPDGLSTRKVPTKGFRVTYISSPFPKLLGAMFTTDAVKRVLRARVGRFHCAKKLGKGG